MKVGTKLSDWKGPWPVVAKHLYDSKGYLEVFNDHYVLLESTDPQVPIGQPFSLTKDTWFVQDWFESSNDGVPSSPSTEPICACPVDSSGLIHAQECAWLAWRKTSSSK